MKTRFILIQTSHAGNVGGTARAMKTMGFTDLVLVASMLDTLVTVTVNGSVALSGTGLVSIVPGVSVVAQVSGTVTAAMGGALATVDAAVARDLAAGTSSAFTFRYTAAVAGAVAGFDHTERRLCDETADV